MTPTVMHLTGRAGQGKTHLLEALRKAHPDALQILTPRRPREEFDLARVNWKDHACIAVDEVLMWEPASMKAGIAAMEAHALQHGRRLILVTQGDDDLLRHGIETSSAPELLRVDASPLSVRLSYDGVVVQARSGG